MTWLVCLHEMKTSLQLYCIKVPVIYLPFIGKSYSLFIPISMYTDNDYSFRWVILHNFNKWQCVYYAKFYTFWKTVHMYVFKLGSAHNSNSFYHNSSIYRNCFNKRSICQVSRSVRVYTNSIICNPLLSVNLLLLLNMLFVNALLKW